MLRDASKEKKLDPDRSGGRRGAEFCLAPGGQAGGFGLRELEALAHNCVPLYVNDNVTRFYDEALSFPEFEVELPEDEIPDIPAALERAAPRVREMRRRAFCACHAVAPSFEPANSKAYWGAWCAGSAGRRPAPQCCTSHHSLSCGRLGWRQGRSCERFDAFLTRLVEFCAGEMGTCETGRTSTDHSPRSWCD